MNLIQIGTIILLLLFLVALVDKIRISEEKDKKENFASGLSFWGNIIYLLIRLLPFKVGKVIYITMYFLLIILFSYLLLEQFR